MHRCVGCGARLTDGDTCDRCRDRAETALYPDGGERDGSGGDADTSQRASRDRSGPDGGDHHRGADSGRRRGDGREPERPAGEQPENWQQGRRPPHWERDSPSRSDDRSGAGGREGHAPEQPSSDGPHQPPAQDTRGQQSSDGSNCGQQPSGQAQPQPHAPNRGGGPEQGTPPTRAGPPGEQRPPRTDDGGRSLGRRELLAGGAGAVALAAGGWWLFLRDRSGPEAVVADFLDAIDDADFAAAQAAIHSDGPSADSLPGTRSEFEERMASFRVDVEALEQYDEQAPEEYDGRGTVSRTDVQRFSLVFVAYTMRRETEDGDPRMEESVTRVAYVARTGTGEWKLWEMRSN